MTCWGTVAVFNYFNCFYQCELLLFWVQRLWWSCWQIQHWSECECVHLWRSKIREMSNWHENSTKTSCPPAYWTDRERAVGGAERSIPPPPLRPESYRSPLSEEEVLMDWRCCLREWKKREKEGKGEKERPKGGWKIERKAESSGGGGCLPVFLTLPEATRWPWPQTEPLRFCSGVWGSVPNLLLLRRKWSWTENASGTGGSDG